MTPLLLIASQMPSQLRAGEVFTTLIIQKQVTGAPLLPLPEGMPGP